MNNQSITKCKNPESLGGTEFCKNCGFFLSKHSPSTGMGWEERVKGILFDFWQSRARVFPDARDADIEKYTHEILNLLSQQKEEMVKRLRKLEEDKKYKAMVAMGDLSFGNYTPTQIYTMGVSDAINSIEKEYELET